MNNCTKVLYDIIDNGDIEEKDIIEFLQDKRNFRSFSESLEYFIKKRFIVDDAYSYLKNCIQDKNIEFNRNTLKNWFYGDKRPKKGEASRENIYKIAFALNLDIDGTIELFENVYLDRAFDLRNLNEFIYFCSLNNNINFAEANVIIESVYQDEYDYSENYTIHTGNIYKEALKIASKEEMLNYIKNHKSNFDYKMLSAKRIKDELLNDILVKDSEIDKTTKFKIDILNINERSSIMARNIAVEASAEELLDNNSLKSVSSMLDLIYGFNINKKEVNEIRKIQNINLLKEIKSRFPTKQTFAKKDPTYEELRKIIILLVSYRFWFEVEFGNEAGSGLDDYIAEINDYLTNANLQTLYVENPYDWFFMYCTVTSDEDAPLSLFRSILYDIFVKE